MARRSYLQRIAEPLRARDPVLFAVRGAGPDEARPAVASAVSDAGAPANALAGRGAPARASSASAPSVAPPLATAAPLPRNATRTGAAPAPIGPANPIVEPTPGPPRSPMAAAAADLPHTGPPIIAATPETDIRQSSSHADSFGEAGHGMPEFAPITPAAAQADRRPPALRRLASSPPAAAQAPGSARPPEAEQREDIALEPMIVRLPPAAASTRAAGPGTTAPRIHIGTVEVRSAAPPSAPVPPPAAAPAAPRADAGPITRAYAWRFGLVQG
jgi:hypothetical protein